MYGCCVLNAGVSLDMIPHARHTALSSVETIISILLGMIDSMSCPERLEHVFQVWELVICKYQETIVLNEPLNKVK